MANPASIQLVCFDLGDVLIRTCRGWGRACERVGLPAPRALDAAGRAAVHALICADEVGGMEADRFMEAMAGLLGLEAGQVRELWEAYLLEPYPGVAALLDELHDAGVATACLSNTNATHWQLMGQAGGPCYLPLERMTHRFASHLVGARKPDEAIYRHVERAAGVQPGRILFFDNLEENIESARRYGWHAELIDPAGDPVGQARSRLSRYAMASNGTLDPQAV